MRRSWIVIALWMVAGAGALLTRRDILFNIWYLLTALLVVSFLWSWSGVRWVRIERQARTTRSQVGKMVEERLMVENYGVLPKLWLELRDFSTLPGHQVSRVISPLGRRKSYTKTIRTRCTQRGRFILGPIALASGDPFGLFRSTRQMPEPRQSAFLVYPATVDVPTFAPLVGFLPGGDTMRRRTSVVTTNVAGVREYAPGDSFSRIHWRSTARTGRLISKEFELDPTADIWLFLDLERGAQVEAVASEDWQPAYTPWETKPSLLLPPSTVEYGITIVASLAKHFIGHDRAVGFIAYSPHRELIPADRGERQMTKILETLAVIRADGQIPLSEIITAEGTQLQRNTTAIVVTSTDDNSWIAAAREIIRRGVRVVTVLIERESFGFPRSNRGLVDELAISGISTYVVREGDDLAQALATPFAQGILPVGRW
jgi:uncharacterized protein (DUF58 family)